MKAATIIGNVPGSSSKVDPMPTETSRPDTESATNDAREPWIAPVVSLVDTEGAEGGVGPGGDTQSPGS
jgi:hypothetical protein